MLDNETLKQLAESARRILDNIGALPHKFWDNENATKPAYLLMGWVDELGAWGIFLPVYVVVYTVVTLVCALLGAIANAARDAASKWG